MTPKPTVAPVVKPVQVKKVKVKVKSESALIVSWGKVKDADGYEVYRRENNAWVKVKTTTKTSYTNSKLTASTKYTYKVRAYKVVNGKKVYGAYSTKVTGLTKPSKVTSIKVRLNSKNQAVVTWKKPTNISGYELYVKNSKTNKYQLLKRITRSSSSQFTKCTIKKNTTYTFKIRTYRIVDGKRVYSD